MPFCFIIEDHSVSQTGVVFKHEISPPKQINGTCHAISDYCLADHDTAELCGLEPRAAGLMVLNHLLEAQLLRAFRRGIVKSGHALGLLESTIVFAVNRQLQDVPVSSFLTDKLHVLDIGSPRGRFCRISTDRE